MARAVRFVVAIHLKKNIVWTVRLTSLLSHETNATLSGKYLLALPDITA